MPKTRGVYRDQKGGWYFKARTAKDPATGKWKQITRRGFKTASDAARARQKLLDQPTPLTTSGAILTVTELVSDFLDQCEETQRLSIKTLFDYRHYLSDYINPWIGTTPISDLDPQAIVVWQRQLAKKGGTKNGSPLAPNTIRLARAPLNGALKHAVSIGILVSNPLTSVAHPKPHRSIPKHWTPEQARDFLALNEGDRLLPVWSALLGLGLRIGELVALRWPNVDLKEGVIHVCEFTTVLGYDVRQSPGKSADAVRSVDLDQHLTALLKTQRTLQAKEKLAAKNYEESAHVFTKQSGGPYHPQYLSRQMGVLSQEAGLPRLTAHGLRHTSSTLMLANGVPPKVAAERLGHADAMLFSNLYSHVTPTMQREAAEQIGNALFGESS